MDPPGHYPIVEKLDWDTILKGLIEESADRLLPILGQHAQIKRWLNVELPKTQNLRVDKLAELTNGRLIHFEIQSHHDPKLPFRMLEYAVAIFRSKGQFPIQIVIYVGNSPSRMPHALRGPGINFHFDVVDLKTLDGTPLLESGQMSDNLIALLTGIQDKVGAIQRIVTRINRLPVNERYHATERLLLTCRLRSLSAIAEQELENMRRTLIDIRTLPVIGPAFREGEEKGKVKVLRRLIRAKFGEMPKWADDRIKACSQRRVDGLLIKVLTADTLEQLFAPKAAKQNQ